VQLIISNWVDPRPQLLKEIAREKNVAHQDNDLGVIAWSYEHYGQSVNDFAKALSVDPSYQRAETNMNKVCQFLRTYRKDVYAAVKSGCVKQ